MGFTVFGTSVSGHVRLSQIVLDQVVGFWLNRKVDFK